MKTRILPSSLLAVALLLVACGGESGTVATGSYAGVYTVDVDRTLSVSGRALQTPTVNHVRASLGADGYRLELDRMGSFTLTIQTGGPPFATSGAWRLTQEGIELRTTVAEGAPVPEETREVVTIDGDHLVLAPEGGSRIFLRRL